MRTTLQINDHLYHLAKKIAAETHRTLTSVIEDALRETFAHPKGRPAKGTVVKLPTFNGKGLYPGIDLDDTNSLLEAMEPHDPFGR
jgi:hypothetical protein